MASLPATIAYDFNKLTNGAISVFVDGQYTITFYKVSHTFSTLGFFVVMPCCNSPFKFPIDNSTFSSNGTAITGTPSEICAALAALFDRP